MTGFAPSRENEKVKIFGLQTVDPATIMNNDPSTQTSPLVYQVLSGGDVLPNSVMCGPVSPVIGPNYPVDADLPFIPSSLLSPGTPPTRGERGQCTASLSSSSQGSNCLSRKYQFTNKAVCTSIPDYTGTQGSTCIWKSFEDEKGDWVQIMSEGDNKYGNVAFMLAPAATHTKSSWTEVQNGEGCKYPPYYCPPSTPGALPAPSACDPPSYVRCSSNQGSKKDIGQVQADWTKKAPTGQLEFCATPNPYTTSPAKWVDSTCSVFLDVVPRGYQNIYPNHSEIMPYPKVGGLLKPALFNNVPFNYQAGKSDASANSLNTGTYCYTPKEDACPIIGDYRGTLHGIAKPTQNADWTAAGYGRQDNTQNLLCEYNPPANLIFSTGPGGFIKTEKDFNNYIDMKISPEQYFRTFPGFPTNDSVYQYIMLNRCMEPVADDEIKNCIGIDGNGPQHHLYDTLINPVGMKPETYWNQSFRLDPALTSKLTPNSKECTTDPCYVKWHKACNASPAGCSECIKDISGFSPPCAARGGDYCTNCDDKPIEYTPDSPRCSRMNMSTKEGWNCRKWYRDTVDNTTVAIERANKPLTNPDWSRAIGYNLCLRAPGKTPEDKAKCGPATSESGVTYKDGKEWTPYPPQFIPGKMPKRSPSPSGSPGPIDWVATRDYLHLGNSPTSVSTAFNRAAKEFCSSPSSQYLFECGCVNASSSSFPNYYANMYNAMQFETPSPGAPGAGHEGYFQATKDEEDAKYCWLSPCKFPFSGAGKSNKSYNEPVRFADVTLAGEKNFYDTDMSICPEYDCESMVISTPDSFMDASTMKNVISATAGDGKSCQAINGGGWLRDPVVCAFGPGATAINGPDKYPPGSILMPPGTLRDPGNYCYQSSDIYPAGSPHRLQRISAEDAFALDSLCFNTCHNYRRDPQIPQNPVPYSFPTFQCTGSGCVEYLPGAPSRSDTKLGEFFSMGDCRKECAQHNREEEQGRWYPYLFIAIILVALLTALVLRKYLIHRRSIKRYEDVHNVREAKTSR